MKAESKIYKVLHIDGSIEFYTILSEKFYAKNSSLGRLIVMFSDGAIGCVFDVHMNRDNFL